MNYVEKAALALLYNILFIDEGILDDFQQGIQRLLACDDLENISPNLRGRLQAIYRHAQHLSSEVSKLDEEIKHSFLTANIKISKYKRKISILRWVIYKLFTKNNKGV